MNHIILTPGEKLQYLRKKHHITQQQLCGDYITRNMLSMIETNKAPLNSTTAHVLLTNLISLCEAQDATCELTLEQLLASVEDQTRKLVLEFINTLDSETSLIENTFITGDYFNQVSLLLHKYDMREEKVSVYHKMGDYFSDLHNYESAYSYYLVAFESRPVLFSHPLTSQLISRLMYCCGRLNKYKESIEFARLAYMYVPDMPSAAQYKIKYNLSITYINLGMFDLALKEINFLLNNFHDMFTAEPSKYINLSLSKAGCFANTNRYQEALEMYTLVLEFESLEDELYILTMLNIMNTYLNLEDKHMLALTLSKCEQLLKNYLMSSHKEYAIEIYKELGDIYLQIDSLTQAQFYYSETLNFIKDRKHPQDILHVFSKLLHIFIKKEDYRAIDDLKEELFTCINLKLIPQSSIISEFIQFYNDRGASDIVAEILDFSLTNYYHSN